MLFSTQHSFSKMSVITDVSPFRFFLQFSSVSFKFPGFFQLFGKILSALSRIVRIVFTIMMLLHKIDVGKDI